MARLVDLALITSAAFVNAELAAEFGQMPPSFLPFGHHRLYSAQIASLSTLAKRLVMTLPQSFEPTDWDLRRFAAENVEVLRVPDALSLGQSILYALTLCDAREDLRILHGDTLFLNPLPAEDDLVGISKTSDAYTWGAIEMGPPNFVSRRPDSLETQERVLTGWFSFSSAPAFLRCLTLAQGDFLRALDLYADAYSLDLVEMADWLDFGHLQTFHRARARVSTARSFNSVVVSGHSVVKTGRNVDKLAAEASWFDSLPPLLRLHTPPFLGKEGEGYRLGYEFSPTLHEVFVFGTLKRPTWHEILGGCFNFLEACSRPAANSSDDPGMLMLLALNKTTSRLQEWARNADVDLSTEWHHAGRRLPSLYRISTETADIALRSNALPGVMHGDFCFPNTFFDFRQKLVKVIDPRGSVQDGKHTIYGDQRYDLAKLNHSIEGYDLILAGRYTLDGAGSQDLTIRLAGEGAAAFLPSLATEFHLGGQRVTDPAIAALTIQLFLSMLPLHADRPDRQQAFVANALRLYAKLEDAA